MSTPQPRAAKRPIDKLMINMIVSFATTQVNQTLRTSLVAETFVGGFITGNIIKGSATSEVILGVTLIIARDGQTVSTINVGVGNALFEPEQDVLWSGLFELGDIAEDGLIPIQVNIKAQRKMKAGDTLRIVALASAANGGRFTASFTGFFKQ